VNLIHGRWQEDKSRRTFILWLIANCVIWENNFGKVILGIHLNREAFTRSTQWKLQSKEQPQHLLEERGKPRKTVSRWPAPGPSGYIVTSSQLKSMRSLHVYLTCVLLLLYWCQNQYIGYNNILVMKFVRKDQVLWKVSFIKTYFRILCVTHSLPLWRLARHDVNFRF
jgi:hypothetical protein